VMTPASPASARVLVASFFKRIASFVGSVGSLTRRHGAVCTPRYREVTIARTVWPRRARRATGRSGNDA
jgi:hypothetical protein